MTEPEYFFECIALKGECPDCHEQKLIRSSTFTACGHCGSQFFGETVMRRVEK